MIGSMALCVILFDEALGYGWLAEPMSATLREDWAISLGEVSQRLRDEAGEDPALWCRPRTKRSAPWTR